MTVERLESEMSSDEYSSWIQYSEYEPFGDIRNNIHTGMIVSMIANVNRKRGTRPYSFKDFMIMTPDEKRENDTREFLSNLRGMAVKNG